MAWLLLLIIVVVVFWHRFSSIEQNIRQLRIQLRALSEQFEQFNALKNQETDAPLSLPEQKDVPPPLPVEAKSGATPEAAPVPFDWGTPPPPPQTNAAPPPGPAPRYAPPRRAAVPPLLPSGPKGAERLFAAAKDWLLGGNTVLRIGVALLFIGFAFLLHFASEQFTLPVELRYIAVAASASVLLALGWRLRLKKPDYALILQGAGIAVLYLTSFAALRLHTPPLLPGVVVFTLLVLFTLAAVALAVLQNARSLACVAVLGGFAAPILTSSGSGDYVALFSYFALLNTGIALVAWFKAWRVLNLIGFVGTFGIGLAWGMRSYTVEDFHNTEAFLILFFLMFVCIGFLFARRKLLAQAGALTVGGPGSKADYLDGTLIFGPPLIGFGLQSALVEHLEFGLAYSALALGLFYLSLAFFTRGRPLVRLMMEVYLSLGVVFGTLAIPLAFESQWTSAAWAVEAAGIYWLGIVQRRTLARAFALFLMAGASFAYLSAMQPGTDTLLDASPLGAALLAGAFGFCHRSVRRAQPEALAGWDRAGGPVFAFMGLVFLLLIGPTCLDGTYTPIYWALVGLCAAWRMHHLAVQAPSLERFASLLLAWGVGWWVWALVERIAFFSYDALPRGIPVEPWHLLRASYLILLALSLSSVLWMMIARPARWLALALACLLPLAGAAWVLIAYGTLLDGRVVGVWLAFFTVHLLVLRRLSDVLPPKAARSAHVVGLWLLLWLLTRMSEHLFDDLVLTATGVSAPSAWRWLSWALVPCGYLWLAGGRLGRFWPFGSEHFSREYRLHAALPVMGGLAIWFWTANAYSDGTPAVLPYIPLFNPLDIGLLLVLLCGWRWSLVRLPEWGLLSHDVRRGAAIGAGLSLFAFATMSVCRIAHAWGGIPFQQQAMAASMGVQTAWSLIWAFFALALMIGGSLRKHRYTWMAGAGLVALVVAKLFFVELSHHGSLARIVSFLGVGALLLIVGYFAPLPPKEETEENPIAQ